MGAPEPCLSTGTRWGGVPACLQLPGQDWAAPYSCKLVSYQTAHSALVEVSYLGTARSRWTSDVPVSHSVTKTWFDSLVVTVFSNLKFSIYGHFDTLNF